MKEQNQILDYLGQTHASHIHARGKLATAVLIELLDCREGEDILEIGFGTGATLLQLASTYKHTKFYGAELSPVMYQKAMSRFRFCMLGNKVQLKLIKQAFVLPFKDHSFDKIYLESVLAIQEGSRLKDALLEIKRLLKPKGNLIMNETIWLDTTPVQQLTEINNLSKSVFGIIHSNAMYPYLQDWKDLLHNFNFEIDVIIPVDEIKSPVKSGSNFPYSVLSRLYTYMGKIKGTLNRSFKRDWDLFKQDLTKIVRGDAKMKEGYIISALNKKQQ